MCGGITPYQGGRGATTKRIPAYEGGRGHCFGETPPACRLLPPPLNVIPVCCLMVPFGFNTSALYSGAYK